MWNGPDNVVHKCYISCRNRPQMNYYNLFLEFDAKIHTKPKSINPFPVAC